MRFYEIKGIRDIKIIRVVAAAIRRKDKTCATARDYGEFTCNVTNSMNFVDKI